ncbi:endonuclease Q family protein [Aquibacillus sp. 3ASR75-11]|uniref:Endonuclease Q family protein n=1 Tax=Terrihalobacillus insolitus TaxID=2950438 RepID=A0A9X3WRT2_9BACI|nr:endonuclease Q family protein [Terrihalobacillus insolitus]MDC3413115.1 endonuclease Q family protein [Terrihalobacillus insolitus]MDC3424857.1 endonuclease Q family protein [Terrihalobacillus insolitus]
MIQSYFADLHIHVGRDIYGKPVKITGSKSLTLTNILKESSRNKGIHMVGVIDCHAPAVLVELMQALEAGLAFELSEGGIQFENVTLLLGSEIEVYDHYSKGPIHVLCFFPSIARMQEFSVWLSTKMKNITLSSQRYYGGGKELQYKTKELDGLFIPAHVFTPFKSMYGKGVLSSMAEVFDPDLIDGIELGLSADTKMADQIEELHQYTFLTNSDAHSLPKIAREYQEIIMKKPTFKELNWALHHVKGRGFLRNYGMNPYLGKYHQTVCNVCFHSAKERETCPSCGSAKIVKGVADRIGELANATGSPLSRPPYVYQVPLEYLPSLGPKTFQKLLDKFGTEMNIIHKANFEALIEIVPENLARSIILMREGKLSVTAGGGGKYGRIDLS